MRSFPLADYEQRVPIRIGSLSQCFMARHSSGEEVLLKQLLPAFARVPAIAAAWLERAEQNSRLDHPGCSRVLDWGEALGESYLTLPVVAAASLRDLLQAAAKASLWPQPGAVIAIAEGALTALVYAQTQFGLPHLDLDPHSVLLRRDGSVLLTEFGMWRALPAEAATRERFDRGRVAYLCPELTKSLEGDARSDVFSLGAILYELLGKERPFQGATQLVTAMAIAEGRRRPVRELAPHAPEILCDIVETMLAQKPDERFQSAQAALGALSSCCQADAGALAEWLGSLELRAGPQAGFARTSRRTAAPDAAQLAGNTVDLPSRHGDGAVVPALGAANGAGGGHGALGAASGTSSQPLPPPLLSPVATAAACAADAPAPDDWLAPPPLLSPGGAPVPLETQAATGGANVRDGRTAFLDTGAARAALAQAGAVARAPEPVAPVARAPAPLPGRAAGPIAAPVPSARFGDAITRDAPAVDGLGLPRYAAEGAPSFAAASNALPGATPPPMLSVQPVLGTSPPEAHSPSIAALSPPAVPQPLLATVAPPQQRIASPALAPGQPVGGLAAAQPLPSLLPPPMTPAQLPLGLSPAAASGQPLLGLSPAAASGPLLAALPPPAGHGQPALGAQSPLGAHARPLASALSSLEYDGPPASDKRGWQEPSKTVFQVKAFAKHATRRRHTRAPLLVMVLLAIAFGFATVAGGALLWRLIVS